MLETNIQQQQDRVSQRLSLPESWSMVEAGLTVICTICEAVYVPSPLQVPFLQSTREALEATFMSTCHFCFRCRRAACPQCWDNVHGVCGSCVQEAHLPFRAQAAPVEGLQFPLALAQPLLSQQTQQSSSLFVMIRNGRFYIEAQASADQAETGIDTALTPAVQLSAATDNIVTNGEGSHAPAADAVAVPAKTPLPAVLRDDRKQEKKPRKAKAARKVNRLELVLTWVLLVIVLVLVAVIALAEYIPAVNALVARVTHIDIHAEIAYLVHIVQQRFKK